jgi:DNA-binding transcriptional ArsR family regulator
MERFSAKQYVDAKTFQAASLVFRAMTHPLRQRILVDILSNKSTTVKELYARLKLKQSEASLHLAILRGANLVISHRHGRFVQYVVNKKRLEYIREFAIYLIQEAKAKDTR